MNDDFEGFKQWLYELFGQQGIAFYAFLGCLTLMFLLGIVGFLLKWPMLFPSIGPTAILFFERGQRPASRPRNVLIGHGVAIAAGWISLVVFGLVGTDPIFSTGITLPYIGSAALSLSLTAFFKHLLRSPHPPAGATTLVISLGIFSSFFDITIIAVSVIFLTISGFLINNLTGGDMPIWGEGAHS